MRLAPAAPAARASAVRAERRRQTARSAAKGGLCSAATVDGAVAVAASEQVPARGSWRSTRRRSPGTQAVLEATVALATEATEDLRAGLAGRAARAAV